jgi:hypothetical protein
VRSEELVGMTVWSKTVYIAERFQIKIGNTGMTGIKHDIFNAGN